MLWHAKIVLTIIHIQRAATETSWVAIAIKWVLECCTELHGLTCSAAGNRSAVS